MSLPPTGDPDAEAQEVAEFWRGWRERNSRQSPPTMEQMAEDIRAVAARATRAVQFDDLHQEMQKRITDLEFQVSDQKRSLLLVTVVLLIIVIGPRIWDAIF